MEEAVFHLRRTRSAFYAGCGNPVAWPFYPCPVRQIAPIGPMSDLGLCSLPVFREDRTSFLYF